MHRGGTEGEIDGGGCEALLVEGGATSEHVDIVVVPHVRVRETGNLTLGDLEDTLPVIHRLILVVHQDGRGGLGLAHGGDDATEERQRSPTVRSAKVRDRKRSAPSGAVALPGAERPVERLVEQRLRVVDDVEAALGLGAVEARSGRTERHVLARRLAHLRRGAARESTQSHLARETANRSK